MKTVKLFLAIAFFVASTGGYAQTEQSTVIMDNINTWEEAIKPLLGKKIYVDIWATWCAPCVAEFKHNEALKKILAENDIQQLYIALEHDGTKWESYIKEYNLTGTHILATDKSGEETFMLALFGVIFSNRGVAYKTKEDFTADINYEMSIPRYVLIDEEGNIMNRRAKRPSQIVAGEKLW